VANIGESALYFYAHERHQRPHVDVRSPGFNATLDIETGEVLAGRLPNQVLRDVRATLRDHREHALEAFTKTLRHEFPGTLDEQLKRDPK
jgi:hypothetical protein